MQELHRPGGPPRPAPGDRGRLLRSRLRDHGCSDPSAPGHPTRTVESEAMTVVRNTPRRWLGIFAKGEGHLPDEVLLLSEARAVQLYLDEYNSRRLVQALLVPPGCDGDLRDRVRLQRIAHPSAGGRRGHRNRRGADLWAVQRSRSPATSDRLRPWSWWATRWCCRSFIPTGRMRGCGSSSCLSSQPVFGRNGARSSPCSAPCTGWWWCAWWPRVWCDGRASPIADLLGYFFWWCTCPSRARPVLSHRRSHPLRLPVEIREPSTAGSAADEGGTRVCPGDPALHAARSAPDVGWLEMAALSLPASEVGGDYYDYFQLDDDRLAVVVGDVTGHGVASGLVLSGVRASLNLLAGEFEDPAAVLGRLNLMLKRTAPRRMHMTLGVAVFDRAGVRSPVALAGHPPAVVIRAGDGSCGRWVGRRFRWGRWNGPCSRREHCRWTRVTVWCCSRTVSSKPRTRRGSVRLGAPGGVSRRVG
jgi:hypothetical protein